MASSISASEVTHNMSSYHNLLTENLEKFLNANDMKRVHSIYISYLQPVFSLEPINPLLTFISDDPSQQQTMRNLQLMQSKSSLGDLDDDQNSVKKFYRERMQDVRNLTNHQTRLITSCWRNKHEDPDFIDSVTKVFYTYHTLTQNFQDSKLLNHNQERHTSIQETVQSQSPEIYHALTQLHEIANINNTQAQSDWNQALNILNLSLQERTQYYTTLIQRIQSMNSSLTQIKAAVKNKAPEMYSALEELHQLKEVDDNDEDVQTIWSDTLAVLDDPYQEKLFYQSIKQDILKAKKEIVQAELPDIHEALTALHRITHPSDVQVHSNWDYAIETLSKRSDQEHQKYLTHLRQRIDQAEKAQEEFVRLNAPDIYYKLKTSHEQNNSDKQEFTSALQDVAIIIQEGEPSDIETCRLLLEQELQHKLSPQTNAAMEIDLPATSPRNSQERVKAISLPLYEMLSLLHSITKPVDPEDDWNKLLNAIQNRPEAIEIACQALQEEIDTALSSKETTSMEIDLSGSIDSPIEIDDDSD